MSTQITPIPEHLIVQESGYDRIRKWEEERVNLINCSEKEFLEHVQRMVNKINEEPLTLKASRLSVLNNQLDNRIENL